MDGSPTCQLAESIAGCVVVQGHPGSYRLAAEDRDDEFVEPEELAEARGILAAEGDCLSLPDRFEINEYRMMESFAAGRGDSTARAELLDALRGSGAFRRFKDTVLRLGPEEEWYEYRDRQNDDVARAWCEALGVELDPPLG